jgi:hypothetical protein
LEDKVDHGHERLYDRLTAQEREVLRDVEARCWGSHDVYEEDVESHLRTITPQAWERIRPVMLARVEASRERQRAIEERQRVLEECIAILRRFRDELLEP